jgi:glycerol-3-phosphate acyltransferase PlsX
MIPIAVDAMGGDYGPKVVVPAVLGALSRFEDIFIHLYGDEAAIHHVLKHEAASVDAFTSRLKVHHCDEVVEMDDPPALAMRGKKRSSMRLAINAVKEGSAKACVSAGNTGALMAIARFVLKTLPGIDRPALIYNIPVLTLSSQQQVSILDLGANVDCSGDNLFQFAIMGNQYAKARSDLSSPRLAMLNVGAEQIKGSESVKNCAQRLEDYEDINYVGYIEGNELYSGTADVIVCDGFVGNVALKVTEGVSKNLLALVKQSFLASFWGRIAGAFAKPFLSKLRTKFNADNYNGASLLGLNGVVIKSHGNAQSKGLVMAIQQARVEAMHDLPTKICASIEDALSKKGD